MAVDMEKLVSLCRRRGFIFQSSEIYGGINGFWDYGPLGVELKKNVKDVWWHDMVRNPPPGPDGEEVTMVGVDCAIIMNPKVWEASGHAKGFTDLMVECDTCKKRFRADKLWVAAFLEGADFAQSMIDVLSEVAGATAGAAAMAGAQHDHLRGLSPKMVICVEGDTRDVAD